MDSDTSSTHQYSGHLIRQVVKILDVFENMK